MHLAVFDHIVPAVQFQTPGLNPLAHHRVAHQALELQHHRALLGAFERLGRDLHRQRGLAAQRQPGGQVHRLGRDLLVQRPDAATVAVAADDDALHPQDEHRVLDGRSRAVVTHPALGFGGATALGWAGGGIHQVAAVRRHKRPHIADHEDLARAGTGQQIGQQARVGAADEQDVGMLAVLHQAAELAFNGREMVVVKAAQPLQQVVGHRA